MRSPDALIAEFESHREHLEEHWFLPWSECRHTEPVWNHELVQSLESSPDAWFDDVAVALIEHESYALRGIALHLIARRQRPGFLLAIRNSLTNDSLHVRALAAVAVGEMRDPDGLDLLLDTKDTEHAEVKKAIVDALRTIGDTRSIPLLARWVGRVGEDDELRRKACQALGSIADDAAMPVLHRVLEDETVADDVREDAAIAIGRIGGTEALLLLRNGLGCKRHCVQLACVRAVGALGERTLIDAVAPIATAANVTLRVEVVDVLGAIGGHDAQRAVEPLAKDEAAEVRRSVGKAIGRLGGARAPGLLNGLLDDASPGVQLAALEAYVKLTGLSVDLPKNGSSEPDREQLATAIAHVRAQADEASA